MDVLSPTFDEWLLFHNAGEVGIIVRLPGATKDTRLKLGQSPALMGRLQLGAAIGEAVVDESELLELPLHGLAGQEEEDNESASGTDTDSSSERDKDLYRVYVTIQKGAEGHQLVVLVRVDAGIVTAADSVPVNIIPLPLGNVSPERTLHMSRWYDVFEAQSRHIIPRYRQRALQPAPLSLESMPRFVGPWLHQEAATQYATDGRKALVVTFVGAGASDNVKAIMGHLFPDWQEQEQEQQEPSKSTRFTLMLCVYDGSDFSWAAVHPNVILVSVRGQMRFWYLKRFVHPDMVPRLVYDYVVVLDEDVVLTPDTFDMRHFLQLLGDHRVDLAQPAHTHTDGRIERMLQVMVVSVCACVRARTRSSHAPVLITLFCCDVLRHALVWWECGPTLSRLAHWSPFPAVCGAVCGSCCRLEMGHCVLVAVLCTHDNVLNTQPCCACCLLFVYARGAA